MAFRGHFDGTHTTVDAGGRFVPKAIRDRLALHTGSEVEGDGAVNMTPVTERMPGAEEAGILVIAPGGQPLTADQVRALRDVTRR
ncbi:MAG: hypothetical protein ACRDRI_06800 [Pseudonocardiaceae bacterium]